jgi:hypothetical protein
MRPSVFVDDARDSACHVDALLADQPRVLTARRDRAAPGRGVETEHRAPERHVAHHRPSDGVAEAAQALPQVQEHLDRATVGALRKRIVVQRRDVMEARLHPCFSLGARYRAQPPLVRRRQRELPMLVGQRLRNAARAETARIRKGSEIGIRTRPGPRGRNVFGAPAAAANDPGDEHRAEAEHRCSHVRLTLQLAPRFHSRRNGATMPVQRDEGGRRAQPDRQLARPRRRRQGVAQLFLLVAFGDVAVMSSLKGHLFGNQAQAIQTTVWTHLRAPASRTTQHKDEPGDWSGSRKLRTDPRNRRPTAYEHDSNATTPVWPGPGLGWAVDQGSGSRNR